MDPSIPERISFVDYLYEFTVENSLMQIKVLGGFARSAGEVRQEFVLGSPFRSTKTPNTKLLGVFWIDLIILNRRTS